MTTAATIHATTRLPTVHHLPCRRADVIVFDDATAPPVPATLGQAAGPVGGDHGGDLGGPNPAAAKASRARSATRPARAVSTRAMALPPKPAPVMRASTAPAATAASTAVSSSGEDTS